MCCLIFAGRNRLVLAHENIKEIRPVFLKGQKYKVERGRLSLTRSPQISFVAGKFSALVAFGNGLPLRRRVFANKTLLKLFEEMIQTLAKIPNSDTSTTGFFCD